MQAFISSCVIGVFLTFGSPVMGLAEESGAEPASEAVMETAPSVTDD
jgi:hypothetical protein